MRTARRLSPSCSCSDDLNQAILDTDRPTLSRNADEDFSFSELKMQWGISQASVMNGVGCQAGRLLSTDLIIFAFCLSRSPASGPSSYCTRLGIF